MLKAILLLSVIPAVASAVPITVGPIYVSGSGEIANQLTDVAVMESFSGSNGTDSVYVNINGLYPFPSGIAGIDGITACNEMFGPLACTGDTFSFGLGGPGFVDIFDSSSNLVASASIFGFVTNDVRNYNPPCGTGDTNIGEFCETFTISPTPEPGSGWLAAIGLGAVVLVRLRRRPLTAPLSPDASEPSASE